MNTLHKLDVLKDTYEIDELDLVLEKLLEVTRHQYRARLEHYEQDLLTFEKRYNMDSQAFFKQFEAGKLGDSMDFFEWAGLYDLYQALLRKIQRLETVA